jgi:hypothetical protein
MLFLPIIGTAAPPVDTAMLLATLSNIGNGSLANLNIPGLTPTPPPAQVPDSTATTTQESRADLPPALAKLLGGFVSAPSPTNSTPSPPSVPRTRNNDPRQRNGTNWPIPQGPSIPQPPTTTTRAPGERKSRWGNANDAAVNNSSYNQAPPQQQQQQNDPWLQRQSVQDPRMAMNNNNYNQVPLPSPSRSNHYQPLPQTYQLAPQQAYQPYQQNQQQQAYQPYQQQQQQQPLYNQPPPQQQRERGAEPFNDTSLPPGTIKGKQHR